MEIKNVLDGLNLSEKETAIYLAALELGPSPAKAIATKAGVQRTHFYDLSNKLLLSGLLMQTNKAKKRLFSAMEPNRLIEIEKNKLSRLEKMLPELNAIFNTSGQKPKIYFYDGLAGINQINADTLRYKGEIIGFTTPRFLATQQRKLAKEYIEQRKALGIKARVIGGASPEILALQKSDKEELRETRVLPEQLFQSEIELGAYGNKIFIVDYKEQFGFIIEGTEIAHTVKLIFEIVWNSGRIL